MRKILTAIFLILPTLAIAQSPPVGSLTRSQVQSSINTNLPTNNEGRISATALRSVLTSINNSAFVWQSDNLPISYGGTGSTTAAGALANLGAISSVNPHFTGTATYNGVNFAPSVTIDATQSANVNFTQAGTGGATHTVSFVFNTVVNAGLFTGADSSGSIDSSDAIQNALNQAAAVGVTTGVAGVVIPCGIYKVTKPIVMGVSNVGLSGEFPHCVQLRRSGDYGAMIYVGNASAALGNMVVANIDFIDLNAANGTTGYATCSNSPYDLIVDGVSDIYMPNLSGGFGCGGFALRAVFNGRMDNPRFATTQIPGAAGQNGVGTGLYIGQSSNTNLALRYSSNIWISNAEIEGGALAAAKMQYGIALDGVDGVWMTGPHSQYTTTANLHPAHSGSFPMSNIFISGMMMDQTYGVGILMDGTVQITRSTLEGYVSANGVNAGVAFNGVQLSGTGGATGLTLDLGVDGWGANGIAIESANDNDIIIRPKRIFNNNLSNGGYNSIYLNGGGNVNVIGGVLDGANTSAVATAVDGIHIGPLAAGVDITGTRSYGNTGYGLNIESGATSITATGSLLSGATGNVLNNAGSNLSLTGVGGIYIIPTLTSGIVSFSAGANPVQDGSTLWDTALTRFGANLTLDTDAGNGTTDEFMTVLQSNIAASASPTGTTNAGTASGNNVLHFASVPAGILPGMFISDETGAGRVVTHAAVVSKTSTTVTMSANAIGAGVSSGDTIVFGFGYFKGPFYCGVVTSDRSYTQIDRASNCITGYSEIANGVTNGFAEGVVMAVRGNGTGTGAMIAGEFDIQPGDSDTANSAHCDTAAWSSAAANCHTSFWTANFSSTIAGSWVLDTAASGAGWLNGISLRNIAATGLALQVPNNTYIASRNAANSADAPLIWVDGSDDTHILGGRNTLINATGGGNVFLGTGNDYSATFNNNVSTFVKDVVMTGLPTSCSGKTAGTLWNNVAVVSVCP